MNKPEFPKKVPSPVVKTLLQVLTKRFIDHKNATNVSHEGFCFHKKYYCKNIYLYFRLLCGLCSPEVLNKTQWTSFAVR